MSQALIESPGADVMNTRWSDLWRLLDRRKAIVVTVLSLASALTEGLGLILLVPMLQALSGGEQYEGGLFSLSWPFRIRSECCFRCLCYSSFCAPA